jgi:ribonuclease G
MRQELIIQAGEEEVQIAVLEEGKLTELFFGESIKEGYSGNIYLGRVENVLPGMQSAFVDIGLNKNAFLYVEEAILNNGVKENGEYHIADYVKKGEEILVQVIKEPVRQKGSRISRQITLPGRYLVLMPLNNHLGISKKIEDQEKVQYLREIMEEIKPPDMGVIVRTVAENISKKCLEEDMENLLETWNKITEKAKKSNPPELINTEKPVLEKIMRDILNHNVKKVIVNNEENYEKLRLFSKEEGNGFEIEMVQEKDLFSHFDIKNQINNALSRKVWLENGGYIVFDETEALTSVDVNTGKYIGKTNVFEDTILETNLEAIKEIVRQIRLRNIGGIIIIDFIDMQDKEKKDYLVEELNKELKKDRIKSHIFGITHLGLVEMTRKKVGSALSSAFERKCQNCEGRGKVTSERLVFSNIKEDLKILVRENGYKTLIVKVSSFMYRYLLNHNAKIIKAMEEKMGIIIVIVEDYNYRDDYYEIEGIYK